MRIRLFFYEGESTTASAHPGIDVCNSRTRDDSLTLDVQPVHVLTPIEDKKEPRIPFTT